jgi:hypothetical protein
VPIGAVGELCIGGIGVARGYLNRPELTAEQFIPDPYGEEPGGRLYRTGDLARFRFDGKLQFLGRSDDQLKIHGFRVEPGEVEAEIQHLSGVRAVAVVGFERMPGQRQLVAYLEVGEGKSITGREIKQFLHSRLPDHMVPGSVTFLDQLPKTPSGKVDRRVLAEREPHPPETDVKGTPPRTSLESELASIWSEVLGIPEVGIHDVFFDIGGHSLAVAQVAARVRQRLEIALPLRVLFEAPTISDLAVEVVTCQAKSVERERIEALLSELESDKDEPEAQREVELRSGG